MIEVDHLTKYYGDFLAIEDVSFKVDKGDIMGFLGPNAAGKSTTMRILTCFMPATSGDARVAGYDVLTHPIEVRKHIGYLPESVPVYTDMTVESYLRFMAAIKAIPRSQRRSKIDSVMEACSLTHRRKDIIGHLSKGYRQRVGIAQALINDPEVLIMDEPTMGLDPKQIIEIRELIKGLGGEHTIILSTHILPEVSMTCNKVVIIDEGHIVAMDTPDNLTAKLRKTNRAFVTVAGPSKEVRAVLNDIQGVLSVDTEPNPDEGHCSFGIEFRLDVDVRANVAASVVRKGWGLLELRPMGMTLEDIFLRLTTKEETA